MMAWYIVVARRIVGPFWTDTGLQAARNLAWLAALTIVTQMCALGSVILLTKSFSPDTFGVFAFALTLQSYLVIVASLGVKPVVIREGTRHYDRIDELTSVHF